MAAAAAAAAASAATTPSSISSMFAHSGDYLFVKLLPPRRVPLPPAPRRVGVVGGRGGHGHVGVAEGVAEGRPLLGRHALDAQACEGWREKVGREMRREAGESAVWVAEGAAEGGVFFCRRARGCAGLGELEAAKAGVGKARVAVGSRSRGGDNCCSMPHGRRQADGLMPPPLPLKALEGEGAFTHVKRMQRSATVGVTVCMSSRVGLPSQTLLAPTPSPTLVAHTLASRPSLACHRDTQAAPTHLSTQALASPGARRRGSCPDPLRTQACLSPP